MPTLFYGSFARKNVREEKSRLKLAARQGSELVLRLRFLLLCHLLPQYS